jgi:hypothetical protein
MHSYSLDTDARKWVYVALGVTAFALPAGISQVSTWFQSVFASLPVLSWPLSFGATFGVVFFAFDRYLWRTRLFSRLHGVPVLQGTWNVEGISSYQLDPETQAPNHRFKMIVVIRQTFTRIEVFTETDDSTSRSTVAGICLNHARPLFRYAFENTPKNKANQGLQRHPGLTELRVNSKTELQGDYFSGKHRLRYGELTFKRSR